MTEYREIAGFPGYRVGSNGTVLVAWVTCRSGRKLTSNYRNMKLSLTSNGYARVNLTPADGTAYRTFRVHRLVLEAFSGPCPDGSECRHLNGIKTDNRLENLRWGTGAENREDNHAAHVYQNGEAHPMRRLSESDVREIRKRRLAGELMRILAAEFGVKLSNISAIVNRRSWKHVT